MRYRLRSLMVLVAIIGLVATLVVRERAARRREAVLSLQLRALQMEVNVARAEAAAVAAAFRSSLVQVVKPAGNASEAPADGRK